MKTGIIKVKFNGVYQWGSGMSLPAATAWDRFWLRDWKGCFWRTVQDHGSIFIVSTCGGGMIHPLDFTLAVIDPDRLGSVLTELREACEKIAEICGGTCTVTVG